MSNPRIIIVGPGAMGCGLSALLMDRGADVALLDHRVDRAAQITREGVRVEHAGREWTARVPCSAASEELGVADLLIVLVKAYATGEAARHATPCVGRSTAVLTLQNGLGNCEAIAEVLARERVLAGTIVMGAASLGVGHVAISGTGDIVLGSPAGNAAVADSAVELLRPYWPGARAEVDVEAALWRKVIVNAAINPLTAITGLPNGALLEDERLREVMGLIANEAAGVARGVGIDGLEGDAAAGVEDVCRITTDNHSSMLQDIAAGRRTEIDQICGEVARRGHAVGVEAPLCMAMTALVGAMEEGAS